MSPRKALLGVLVLLALLWGATSAGAVEEECNIEPRSACFGISTVVASLSTSEAGAHPDVSFSFDVKQDPETTPNVFALKDSYAATRNVIVNLPPGLIGDPNTLGPPQQCSAQELIAWNEPGGGCPNGSQIGIAHIKAYELLKEFPEPIYMMQPPGGDVIARLGLIAGLYPTFIELRVRSEGDYGLVSEIRDAPTEVRLVEAKTTFWGVPADPSHDNERCTPGEVLGKDCVVSLARPPGSRALPFFTNPTSCAGPLEVSVNASSWLESGYDPAKEKMAFLPAISGCDRLPYGPSVSITPTNRHPASPTGLDVTLRQPASDGVGVLEPAQTRDIRIELPEGFAVNPGSADGLQVCSAEQVGLGRREEAYCPDAAKLASTEFEVAALPRRMKGAIYLREPEPGDPFRIWVVADDLGAHVKLPGELEVDKTSGQIDSVVLGAPQVPLREVRLLFKSGFRAPLLTSETCGTYSGRYEFTSWAGGPLATGKLPMRIDEGCEGLGGFAPELSAGSTDATGGRHAPFVFTLTRQDGEQNPASFNIILPRGLAASFAGVARCEGTAAQTGACPAASQIGTVKAAVGAGPAPLWVPQPGKRKAAVYLSGPYEGAPISIVAVVPRQAGPFDFGDEVVRSAVEVDPHTAQATAKTDPLPQLIEGIPIRYRALHVALDRPGFALNPTSCEAKQTTATLTSTQGTTATATSPFAATDCAKLHFAPKLALRMSGGTHRGGHPKLTATLRLPGPGANLAGTTVTLPRSEFIENAHFKTICTRVQFAADQCPPGSVYGYAKAKSPLFDETLQGPVYLRSSNHPLPDLVLALKGPPGLPLRIEVVGRVDSVGGHLRTSIETVPDAPITYATLQMRGGKKGLFVNSRSLCEGPNRAKAFFTAQNGKRLTSHPALRVSCKQEHQRR